DPPHLAQRPRGNGEGVADGQRLDGAGVFGRMQPRAGQPQQQGEQGGGFHWQGRVLWANAQPGAAGGAERKRNRSSGCAGEGQPPHPARAPGVASGPASGQRRRPGRALCSRRIDSMPDNRWGRHMNASAMKRPAWFRVVAVLALLWNLFGLAMAWMLYSMMPDQLAQLTEAQRTIHAAFPGWLWAVDFV